MTRFDFFSLLPPSMLKQIDNVVSMEVTPYIKTMGALPERIQKAAYEAAESEQGDGYLGNLICAWRQHNDLASEIDRFLVELYTGKRTLYEVSTIQQARIFLPKVYETEDRKRIYSVGVKLALDINLKRATQRYSLTEEEKTLLLSCWIPDFWTYRLHSHADYVFENLSGYPDDEKRATLANTFHAGEPVLLHQRLPQILGENRLTKEAAQRIIADCVLTETRVRDFAVTGCYLVISRPDLKAIQKLVQYDNREEYLFSSNMFGMPDFFLRKEIAHVLISAGIIEQRPSIVFYSQNELDYGLQKLQETCNGSWQADDGRSKYSTGIPTNHPNNLWCGLCDDGARGTSRNSSH
jgi:hypothetical protein